MKGTKTPGPGDRGWRWRTRPTAEDSLPADVTAAIKDLLSFVWEHHFRDAEEEDIGPELERVFRSQLVVDNWLFGTDAEPEGGWQPEAVGRPYPTSTDKEED